MIKRTFKMTIEVDEEKLKKQYPNFNINYSSVEDFIDNTAIVSSVDNYKKIGYRVKIEKEVVNNE